MALANMYHRIRHGQVTRTAGERMDPTCLLHLSRLLLKRLGDELIVCLSGAAGGIASVFPVSLIESLSSIRPLVLGMRRPTRPARLPIGC
jgi:hypothetical protein